jgi:hypothetical protein
MTLRPSGIQHSVIIPYGYVPYQLVPSPEMYADISTIFLEQSPAWEVSQQINGVVCTPNVHHYVHKSLPRVTVARQIN